MSRWYRRVTGRHERYCRHVRLYNFWRSLFSPVLAAVLLLEMFALNQISFYAGRRAEHWDAFHEGIDHAWENRFIGIDSDEPPPDFIVESMGDRGDGTWRKTYNGWLFMPRLTWYTIDGLGHNLKAHSALDNK